MKTHVILFAVLFIFILKSKAQSTIYGGNATPMVLSDGYATDYSPAGTFILADGNITLSNNSIYEHGNDLLNNLGSWISLTGSKDLFTAVGNNTISGFFAPNFYNASFNIGASNVMDVTNNQGINIFNLLDFNNGISTTRRSANEAGAIRFQNGANYTGANSNSNYVNGYVSNVSNSNFTFPVGNQNSLEQRTLATSGMNNTSQLSIAYWAGDVGTNIDPTGGAHNRSSLAPGLISVSPIGFWDWIAVSGNSSITTVTVSIPDMSVLGGYGNSAEMRLVGWDINTNRWEILGTAGTVANTAGNLLSGTINNMADYSAIAIGNVLQNPLPVNLVSFVGTMQNCAAFLKWKTTNEINSNKYVVEISTDGISFLSVGQVISLNNTTGATYNFSYKDLRNGANFFRLKMIDNNGTFTYSSIIMLNNTCGYSIVIGPNPVSNVVYIKGLQKGNVVIIYNAIGQQMTQVKNIDGAFTININMENYTPGVYIIKVVSDNKILVSERIIKH